MVFWIFGGLFLLYTLISGWRRGLVRQSISVFAMVAAYCAGIFGGKLLVPILRGLGYPDFAISVLAGAAMGLLVWIGISSIGTILFKKTSQQDMLLVRWGYGLGGALLNLGFGLFLLWFAFVSLRLLGTMAETEIKLAHGGNEKHENRHWRGPQPARPDPGMFVQGVANLKHSVDDSPVGEFAQKIDPLPGRVYSMMENTTKVIANQDALQRFMEFPGVKKISESPKIRRLLEDPEIVREARERNYLEMMKNKRLIEALNDPQVFEMIKKVDLEKALEFALRNGAAPFPQPLHNSRY
jgi:hypothetical protein